MKKILIGLLAAIMVFGVCAGIAASVSSNSQLSAYVETPTPTPTPTPTSTCTPPPSDMVSWWGGDNNALDIEGTNHGALHGGATYAAGMVGQAFSFDGTGDYVTTADSADWDLGAVDFTIDAWINTTTPDSTMRLISAGNEPDGDRNLWAFGFGSHPVWGSGCHLNFAIYDVLPEYIDLSSNEIALTSSDWHHIACVRNGTTLYFYFDGAAAGTADIGTVSMGGGSTGAIIGARYRYSTSEIIEYATGKIDEVELFNRALSADEIAAIYNAGSAGKCKLPCQSTPSGLVSLWKAEDNPNDSIGTNHGAPYGDTTYAAGMVGQAFSFDGADDYVNVPKSASLDAITTTFSIDAWVYPDAFLDSTPSNYDMGIVVREASYQGYALGTYQNQFAMIICTGSELVLAKSSPASPDTWYHVTGTYNGTHACIYVNGVLEDTAAAILSTKTDIDMTIGTGIIRPFDGLIDEIAVFNRALSAQEIADIYNAGGIGVCAAPSEVWVDDNYNAGSCGGHTWDYDAFDTIQEGIDAVSGSIVHVAEGTYYENIVLKDGVELLGNGSATTIIDGMQNGSVITATDLGNTTRVDGFTVTNGSTNTYGGGMFNTNASPAVTNCTFISNSAALLGGGIANFQSSSPAIANCTFQSNTAVNGGGMYNEIASPTIVNCTFTDNSASIGGGMHNNRASPNVSDCIFTNNSASSGGGGMYNDDSPSDVSGCTFTGNSAEENGGAMYNYDSSPTVSGCAFTNNSANGNSAGGGAMYNYSSSPTVSNCSFTNNSAPIGYGGAMYNDGSTPVITNCIFLGNSAYYGGGGIYNYNYSNPTITNCTFYNNSGSGEGGDGIYSEGSSSPTVTNCIFWDVSTDEISGGGDVTYSDVQGELYTGTGNINSSPSFRDAPGGDLRLNGSSPCIDTGYNDAVPVWLTTDLDGNARIIDGNGDTTETVDMGAYELACFGPFTLTYNTSAGGSINGTSPQTGIACSGSGTEVTAVPNLCYRFVNWSDSVTTASRTDINVTDNITVTANFVINQSTLTYNAGAGGLINGTTPQTVNCGTNGTEVTAVSNPCFHFVNWSDGRLTASRTDTNVTNDITVTANFAPSGPFTLIYNAGTGGSINGTTPQTVNCSENGAAVTAVPNAGYYFSGWSDGNTDNPRTDNNVQADVTVTANFRAVATGWMPGDGTGGGTGAITAGLSVLGFGQLWQISPDGYFLENAVTSSPDGSVTISIPTMTQVLSPSGLPVTQITVNNIDPPPAPEGMHVLAAFSFQPSGATFSPGIQITLTFDPAEVAEGGTVAIAFYNEATGAYEFIEGTVSGGVATFTVSHFTIFAVLAGPSATGQLIPGSTPAASSSVAGATPAPSASAASSSHASGGLNAGTWAGIAVGIILALLIVLYIFMRWRKKLEY